MSSGPTRVQHSRRSPDTLQALIEKLEAHDVAGALSLAKGMCQGGLRLFYFIFPRENAGQLCFKGNHREHHNFGGPTFWPHTQAALRLPRLGLRLGSISPQPKRGPSRGFRCLGPSRRAEPNPCSTRLITYNKDYKWDRSWLTYP